MDSLTREDSSGLSEIKTEAVSTTTPSGTTEPAKRKTPARRTRGSGNSSDEEATKDLVVASPILKSPRRRKAAIKSGQVKIEDEQTPPTKGKRKRTKPEQPDGTAAPESEKPKTKRTRKTKEEKEASVMPLAARTLDHKLLLGAHVSASGGVHNSVLNAHHIGANTFALFLKSQRKWTNPPLDPLHASTFHAHCTSHSYDQHKHVVPHGSYLVNLAHPDPARTSQAYTSFLDDLRRCETLGIALYNFHPGNTVGLDRRAAISHLAANLNRAHAATSSVTTLLENMAATGSNVLGSSFEDLRDIIALVHDKSRVGVCLDTCHAFAAGYDLRSPAALEHTLARFDELVGLEYLRALHVNDSKAPFGSGRDLHANIGTGCLGLRAFHALVNEKRVWGLPMVLETPIEVRDEAGEVVKDEKGRVKEDKGIWAREIKMLEGLVGVDVEDDRFLEMEARLARMGEGERRRLAEQVERRRDKVKGKEVKERLKAEKKAAAGAGNKKTRAKKAPTKTKKVSADSDGESDAASSESSSALSSVVGSV